MRAFRSRDPSYDGIFFTGVRTTGVFCRPSCQARKPLERNVEFFPTAKQALFAGYRPCRRCRPLATNGRPPAWVRRLLERVERDPGTRIRDADVRAMGIDPSRARRHFQRHFGMTFAAYARARRLGDALGELRRGADMTATALKHGHESTSGFRDGFAKAFGRTPGRGRAVESVVTTMIESPVGPLLAGASDAGVCLLEFTDRRALEAQLAEVRKRFGGAVVPGQHKLLDRLRDELDRYFEGKLRRFTVPLTYPGTAFQRAVWSALLKIPYGQTRSYEDVARMVGDRAAVRAVGRANGQNRIAIVIPCHRVVNKNGQLGGYGGGLWRKQLLLDLERGQRQMERPTRRPVRFDPTTRNENRTM